MKVRTYDCGYGVAIFVDGVWHRFHLPFPVTVAGWRYLARQRKDHS